MTKRRSNLLKMCYTAVLAALIFILEITHIGYIPIGVGVEITIIVVPVAVGAIIAGPTSGAFLGFVFGITSFLQCFKGSIFGTSLLNISSIRTAILCFIPRILMGLLCGFIYRAMLKWMKDRYSACVITSLCAAILNTILFTTALVVLFGTTDFIQNMMQSLGARNFFSFAVAFVGLNGLIEAVVCTLISFGIGTVVIKFLPDANQRIR